MHFHMNFVVTQCYHNKQMGGKTELIFKILEEYSIPPMIAVGKKKEERGCLLSMKIKLILKSRG